MNRLFLIVIVLIWHRTVESIAPYPLNMYHTDFDVTNTEKDRYRIYLNTVNNVNENYFFQHHFYTYCMRSNNYTEQEPNNKKSRFSFSELREKNITYQQLFEWSAPIDLIERYEMFLNNATSSDYFYNCTWPLFGPTCQFYFEIRHNSILSLIQNSLVEYRNDNDDEDDSGVIRRQSLCYKLLNCSYIHPLPMCLTWREICDGKMDCLNGGIDEENCFQLELNECDDEHEYRCHNGQCIPKAFWRDNPAYPDCLDRSDEAFKHFRLCYIDNSMGCHDHTCRPGPADLACGDGECDEVNCLNRRNERLSDSLITKPKVLPYLPNCWSAISCLARIHIVEDQHECICDILDHDQCVLIISKQCPTVFIYPVYPVALGHIYFVYTNNQSYRHPIIGFALPMYVCYDEKYCPFLSSSPFFSRSIYLSINSTMSRHCHKLDDLAIVNHTRAMIWEYLQRAVEKKYRSACPMYDQLRHNLSKACHPYSQLYSCQNSMKCISKHRLLDGILDCPKGDDETYTSSCSLTNAQQRFHCSRNQSIDCISPLLIDDKEYQCARKLSDDYQENPSFSPERFNGNSSISFQTLCDGFEERYPILMDDQTNETDETNCQQHIWPCNNSYTYCNHIWNCPNGLDEISCSPMDHDDDYLLKPVCKSGQYTCISPVNYTLQCLNISQINDNIIDCLGGADERHICRKFSDDPSFRYLCRDHLNCISTFTLCDLQFNCLNEEDEKLCSKINQLDDQIENEETFICTRSEKNRKHFTKNLCSLDENNKPSIVYFSLASSASYPSAPKINSTMIKKIHKRSFEEEDFTDIEMTLFRRLCNRGIPIRVQGEKYQSTKPRCLCPPNFYGSRCQFENQRISLTIQFQADIQWRIIFTFLIRLVDDDQTTHSYEQLNYLSMRDCQAKYHLYLLYKSRMKDSTKTYAIQIDAFIADTLEYRGSWYYPIQFSFLPVHRLAIQLNIPILARKQTCSLDCGAHGTCVQYENSPKSFCRCQKNWKGFKCEIAYECHCSSDAWCMESSTVCLCPLHKYGSKCYLQRSVCQPKQSSLCKNNGLCLPTDIRLGKSETDFQCVCQLGFSGEFCQNEDTRVEIRLNKEIIGDSMSLFAHFITANGQTHPSNMTMLSKIYFDQTSVIFHPTIAFHLIFVEISQQYYLVYLNKEYPLINQLVVELTPSYRCLHINEFFNQTILNSHPLRRAKYYHLLCREHLQLPCFHDSETFMCLCNLDHHANCFNFHFHRKQDCQGNNYCLNEAQCFQDLSRCPTMSVCSCSECFYGTLCQFSTEINRLSLDAILGYHIRPQMPFSHQSTVMKISTALIALMYILGLLSGFFSMLTFLAKKSREVGCGMYLLSISIINLLIIHVFLLKFLFLLLIQMGKIDQRWFLKGNCLLMDFLLRILLNTVEWLSAFVAIERTTVVVRGVKFNKKRSRCVSKWMIMITITLCTTTGLLDPFNRHLVTDIQDNRIWCVVNYESHSILQQIDSILIFLHLFIPFLINFLSSILVVILAARVQSTARKESFLKHFRKQIQQHYHLLISACLLIILALPRIIIPLIYKCIKSSHEPWFALFGYLVSFMPPVLVFIIFVLPSQTYKKYLRDICHRRVIR